MLLKTVMLATALSLVLPGVARAADPAPAADVQAEVERLYAEGAALYKGGKYRAAIDKFQQAYALYAEPNLLFNIARAHEALGELDQAIATYRQCAAHPQAGPDVATRARDKATLLEAAKANSAATPMPSPNANAGGGASPAPMLPAPAPSSGPPVLAIAGGSVAGLGLVAGVVGGVVYALGADSHGRLEAAKDDVDGNGVATLTRVEAEALAADGSGLKTAGVGLLIGGGVALAIGVPLLVVGLLGE